MVVEQLGRVAEVPVHPPVAPHPQRQRRQVQQQRQGVGRVEEDPEHPLHRVTPPAVPTSNHCITSSRRRRHSNTAGTAGTPANSQTGAATTVWTYWVKVFADGVMIGQRAFVVAQYREAAEQ